ncbi:Crp/Fnr family transcriptional regulator [Waterburya agarophytonicola K14]|uniref:Crp/Fnr family transcriptional regulator n=1 Tax=Waterburya agarophytonicola KI4 TaxID=2874699 RepID=A0A964FF56_9CYAN|nr:Crp/Fnr family transcriptional regulator [Waterburya agarophytonicola]MCC0175454.1 Crp/Fnr family transcriptional regulator [Waterburya agarophytonicola KI4]
MEDQSRYLESNIDREELIKLVPFMSGLPEESIHKIAAHFVTISHPANQVLLLENDWGGSVYFILEGWVKIRTYNLDGKEVTLNIIGRGEIFGEMAAMDKLPRSTDAITLTKTLIGRIPAEDFVNLINTEPTAGVHLVQLMAKRLRQVNRRLQLREASSVSRVADAILFLVEGQGTEGEQGTEIPNLPHREISSLSGLARETVTRVLTKLEKKGLIQRNADFMHIPDVPALEDTIC